MLRTISSAFSNSITVFFVSWLSMLLVGRIFDFHQRYIALLDQIKSETWLLRQCVDDDQFYHNMAYHTDVCTQVITNSQISPVLSALSGSLSEVKLCGFYDCQTFSALIYKGGLPLLVCVGLFYVLTPSFLIPWMHIAYTKHQERIFENRCSPAVTSKQHIYKRLGNVHFDI